MSFPRLFVAAEGRACEGRRKQRLKHIPLSPSRFGPSSRALLFDALGDGNVILVFLEGGLCCRRNDR